jgi:hypothetical protein
VILSVAVRPRPVRSGAAYFLRHQKVGSSSPPGAPLFPIKRMFPESGRQLCATQVNRRFTFAAKNLAIRLQDGEGFRWSALKLTFKQFSVMANKSLFASAW